MIAVIFEVEPRPDRRDAYLEAAARLKPLLESIDGFVSVERFESLTTPGKILSLSVWRDEEAVHRWRNLDEHRRVQAAGRQLLFADYRLRVAAIIRDYGMNDRAQAPEGSALAAEVAGRSPDAIRAAKRLYDEAWTGAPEETLALEASAQRGLIGSQNQIAAVTAGMTKQPAEFADPEPARTS